MPILLGADVHTRERSGLSAPLTSAQRCHDRRGNHCEADVPYRLRPSLPVRRYETVRTVRPSMTYFVLADDPAPGAAVHKPGAHRYIHSTGYGRVKRSFNSRKLSRTQRAVLWARRPLHRLPRLLTDHSLNFEDMSFLRFVAQRSSCTLSEPVGRGRRSSALGLAKSSHAAQSSR
jgi:hypothetical protein